MTYSIVDPADFTSDGVFFEDAFVRSVNQFDWSQYSGRAVLVRGCRTALMPPWALMLITGKLTPIVKSVRYGNEHDNIVIYRRPEKDV